MAPTLAARTQLTRIQDQIIDTLAACDTFVRFTQMVSGALAKHKAFIHRLPETVEINQDHYTDDEWATIFPCVTIQRPQGASTIRMRHDASPYQIIVTHAEYDLRFERKYPAGMDSQDADRDFEDTVMEIIEEFAEQGNTPGMCAASDIYVVDGPGVNNEFETLGPTQVYIMRLEFNVGSA